MKLSPVVSVALLMLVSAGTVSAQHVNSSVAPSEENVTPRIRGAIAEFPDGGYYEFGSDGTYVISAGGYRTVGRWRFKDNKKSLYCGTVVFQPEGFRSSECRRIVKRNGRYFVSGPGVTEDLPIARMRKFSE